MTRVNFSVPYDASLAEVAEALDVHRVRQLPVMRAGKMVRIISRADLVRALADMALAGTVPRFGNGQVQKLIWEQIRQQPWLQSAYLNLSVKEGVVAHYGAVQSQDQHGALLVLVNRVPGVRRVEDVLTVMPRVIAA